MELITPNVPLSKESLVTGNGRVRFARQVVGIGQRRQGARATEAHRPIVGETELGDRIELRQLRVRSVEYRQRAKSSRQTILV
jgi:hypothetical protein